MHGLRVATWAIGLWGLGLALVPGSLRTNSPSAGRRLGNLVATASAAQGAAIPTERLLGRLAPDFPVKPGYGLVGPRLSSLHGKVVLLDFWATWCRPCLRALPDLQDLHEKLSKAGLQVVGISADRPREVASILAEKGASYPQVFDLGGRIAARYAVSAFPTLVLIGRDGRVKKVSLGGLEPILVALAALLD